MQARALIVALVLIVGCGSPQPASPDPGVPPPVLPPAPIRVLMVTVTAGFRHDSISAARSSLAELGAANGFSVAATDDVGSMTAASLVNYDVLMFALTTGELPLSETQKAAILSFVNEGKGFVGVHSATDTLYTWPEYGSLIGAYFSEHPWTQSATVLVEDSSHPASTGLGDRFTINEEFYVFRENPRGRVSVLLRLDPASVGAAGDYPLAWARSHGQGRVYYNALGHFAETWRDPRFGRQIVGAVRWAARR